VGKEHVESILLTVYGELGGREGCPSAPWWGQGGCDIPLPLADLVPKPTVTAKVIRDELERCSATLECSVELEGVTYEWIFPSKLPLEGAGASEQHISFNPLVETYICKVSNPVSSDNASLTYRHPCSWTGTARGARTRWESLGGMGDEVAFGGSLEQWWWP